MKQALKVVAKLLALQRNASRSREELLELRDSLFRRQLKYAWRETDFYPRFYRRHGLTEDCLDTVSIEEVPPLTKELYRERFDEVSTDPELTRDAVENYLESEDEGGGPEERGRRFLGRYEVVHSSGTTGEPTYFVYGEDEWLTVLAGALRAIRTKIGVFDGLRSFFSSYDVLYVAATGGRFAGVTAMQNFTDVFDASLHELDVNEPEDRWRKVLESVDFDVVVGYPSGVKLASEVAGEHGVELDVDLVVTGGEPLSPELRGYLESKLDADVFNVYGAAESILMGVEGSGDNGVRLFDDLVYVEPREDHTLITPLHRRTQPLIRYRLDDKLSKRDADESTTVFTVVDSVVGRSEELMWFETVDGDRDFLHPLVLDEVEAEGLQRYQFVQTSDTGFEIRFEVGDDADVERLRLEIQRQVEEMLAEKQLTELEFGLTEVDGIPVDPDTGKRKMVSKEMEG